MKRRRVLQLLGGLAVLSPIAAHAITPRRQVRIGVLALTTADANSVVGVLREGLRHIGYTEGQNVEFDIRAANGRLDRLSELAADLVNTKVDVILATFTPCALAAKHATERIPIVAVAVGDPIGAGLAASLARPGGNVTGLTNLGAETAGKCVELLRDIVPSLRRAAVLTNPGDPFTKPFVEHVIQAGRVSNVDIQPIVAARGPERVEEAFAAIADGKAEAVVVQGVFFTKVIAELAIKHGLPSASVLRRFSAEGGLITYGASVPDLFRRSVVYVQKILQGVPPEELPIEQPTRFELVVNLRTARTIGLSIPEPFLARADEIIE